LFSSRTAWDREILTTAQGDLMTTVPATTDMHYRIGGITETFMSTLLLRLVEQGASASTTRSRASSPNLLAADQVTVQMLVAYAAGYIDYVTDGGLPEPATGRAA
jgi:D-alanyl-D-alanine carboxypeptidase